MQRFKNILVALTYSSDNDIRALNKAFELARMNQARLTILQVQPIIEKYWAELLPDMQELLSQDHTRQHFNKRLTQLLSNTYNEGHPYETKFRTGIFHLEVIQQVLEDHHDLVIHALESDDNSGPDTDGMHLLRKCPCPVWLVHERIINHVVAAIDPDPTKPELDEQNKTILDIAASQAIVNRGQLHLMHAISVPNWASPENSAKSASKKSAASWKLTIESRYLQNIERLVSDYLDLPITTCAHFALQPLIPLFQDIEKRTPMGMLVMGSIGRSYRPGYFIGRQAESLLQHSQCSVIAVKPKNFEVPVPFQGTQK